MAERMRLRESHAPAPGKQGVKVWVFSFPSADLPDLILDEAGVMEMGAYEIRGMEIGNEAAVRVEEWDRERFLNLPEWSP